MDLEVIALPTAVADHVRTRMEAPGYGHPAHVETARGDGPCRHCLRPFAVGEDRRILFTLDPFDGVETLPLPGPVFIHADACPRHGGADGVPRELAHIPMTLNAYARGRRLVSQSYASGTDVEPALREVLARADVDYVHVRHTRAGCYLFRVERAA